MDTDWDIHLAKINRRSKKARKATSCVVLFLLVVVGLWIFIPMIWKEKVPSKSPKVTFQSQTAVPTMAEGRVYYDNKLNELRICDGNSWTAVDANDVVFTSGELYIGSVTECADIVFDSSTSGDYIEFELR